MAKRPQYEVVSADGIVEHVGTWESCITWVNNVSALGFGEAVTFTVRLRGTK